MATQQDTPNLPDLQTVLAGLGTVGAGVLGVLKWIDSRKKEKKEDKTTKEDWLIDNAFDIVKELRAELSRLRLELQEEKERSKLAVDALEAKLRISNTRARKLINLLVQNGIAVPDREALSE